MRIAVDAMGGDHAPAEIVKGAVEALGRFSDTQIVLVGVENRIRPLLEGAEAVKDRLTIVHAAETIDMGESPVEALRRKPDNSITRCVEALRRREVDAFVSAGDTGAVVAAATLFGQRLRGVKRQGIAVALPTLRGRTLLMDVGANVHCKPIHLLQYAIMASAYCQEVLGVADPRVGLLSVGEEEGKGNELVKHSRHLFGRAGLNFAGNIEGQMLFQGVADAVVCDGFVGNVILKVAEGLAEALVKMLSGGANPDAAGGEAKRPSGALAALKEKFDYSVTGGAPLLGVDGSVIICHGRSNATAIVNAVKAASDFARSRVNEKIVEGVARVGMVARMAEFFHRDHE